MKVGFYIHGVPNGQRIWGNGGDDQVINQFYGAASEEQTKFLAEVRKSGGQNFCYYSILKYNNVSAESGRAGSYFGLTIKMDMVCTKVKTMFQILDLIYNSAIVGKFLKKEGERLQYIISDFKEKEDHCKAIFDKIMTLLGQSLDGNDFVSITPSMLNGKGTPKYNLAEYSSEIAFANLNQYGSVAVSAEYPSAHLASFIKKKEAEVSALRQQSAKELQEQEQRSNAAIQQTREQAHREIEQTKARYSDIDKKVLEHEQTIKHLHNNVEQLQLALQDRERMIEKLKRMNASGQAVHGSCSQESMMGLISTRILPFVNLLIGVVVLVVLFLRMPSDSSKTVNQISSDLTELKTKITNQKSILGDTIVPDSLKLHQ